MNTMTTKYTGEQAFPSVPAFPSTHELMGGKGMTMRDYFAAKAMQGLMAMCATGAQALDGAEHCAKLAYVQADEMLKAREI